ncbi:STM2901 family protein [Tenacibaculum finnmarkense]|uniref:STM2901 family protein n=2 Tax=Tenacibaculum finnmarkense TaxID=2781243 RepID=UPI000C505AC6|nr:hypothetical protein [Tenacibaculum finnmarkense]MCD8440900.1 hypothetical protein [Tenacibaculum finnmarkense genomovar ulcerans]MCG8721816.1 hypothetical protein [Tenacibaculum finnmarkense]SOS56037.1 conserved hypothetical protein [Tenacibaculum finnmarkense]
MIESKFETVDLSHESYKFREELRNQLLLQANYSDEPGTWEYEGKWYFSKFDLYIAILTYEVAEQFGILDVIGLTAVLSGLPFIPTRAKFKGATKGTSVASKYLSKIPGNFPVRLPMATGLPRIIGGKGMRISLTKVIGKFVGRTIPFIGWGILAYDLSIILYDTQLVYNHIIDEK